MIDDKSPDKSWAKANEVRPMRSFAIRISKVRYKPKLEGLTRKIDILAEYLACEYTVAEAAKIMGITYTYANAMLQRIRRQIGDRAV